VGTWAPVAWSADGTRLALAYWCVHECTEAAVLDLATGALTRLGIGSPVDISADGARVLLQDGCASGLAMEEPHDTLRIVAADGSGDLTRIDGPSVCGADWAPRPEG
jgi:hypothetical protein